MVISLYSARYSYMIGTSVHSNGTLSLFMAWSEAKNLIKHRNFVAERWPTAQNNRSIFDTNYRLCALYVLALGFGNETSMLLAGYILVFIAMHT